MTREEFETLYINFKGFENITEDQRELLYKESVLKVKANNIPENDEFYPIYLEAAYLCSVQKKAQALGLSNFGLIVTSVSTPDVSESFGTINNGNNNNTLDLCSRFNDLIGERALTKKKVCGFIFKK